MGIDAEIYYQSLDGEMPTELYQSDWFKICQVESHLDTEATHCISSYVRYYGEYYERGPWQQICGVLMVLLASTNVGKVWYFGDHSSVDEVHPVTIEDVLRISHHYMLNAERPYRQKHTPRISVPAATIEQGGK